MKNITSNEKEVYIENTSSGERGVYRKHLLASGERGVYRNHLLASGERGVKYFIAVRTGEGFPTNFIMDKCFFRKNYKHHFSIYLSNFY